MQTTCSPDWTHVRSEAENRGGRCSVSASKRFCSLPLATQSIPLCFLPSIFSFAFLSFLSLIHSPRCTHPRLPSLTLAIDSLPLATMRFSVSVAAASLSLLSASYVQGYGILGHTLTGQVAQLFLTPETAKQVKEILSPYYDGLLSKAAPWPDTIKGQAKYRWASIFHYVNTPGDNPPENCQFQYSYNGKDVVNGLFNMTTTLHHFKQAPPTTPEERSVREDALRFFVHFMGDVHQPLHASGKSRGGNDAPAKWGRAKTNLHRIWDGQLILKDIKDRFDNNPKAYLDNMIDMASSFWQPEAANWTECDPEQNQGANPWSDTTQLITKLCPMQWARAMNQLDCTFVWKDYDASQDYSSVYFEKVTGEANGFLVQKLIAMSGIRMAAVLNQIYDPPVPERDHDRFLVQGPARSMRFIVQ